METLPPQSNEDIPAPALAEEGREPWVNPPDPLNNDGSVDLNKLAQETRDGKRKAIMTIGEALSRSGGYHNAHMVNPELHPDSMESPDGMGRIDMSAIQAALKKARESR
jgi:hypothetical protein